MVKKGLKIILVLVLLLVFSISCFAESFVGRWAWIQHTTNMYGHMSLCVGDLIVRRDNTFWIWNACKVDNQGEYLVVEAEGTWEKVSKNIYRAYYGCYYYDVIVRGGVGMFSSMSVCDRWDRGNMEFGIMLKNVNINRLRDIYESH